VLADPVVDLNPLRLKISGSKKKFLIRNLPPDWTLVEIYRNHVGFTTVESKRCISLRLIRKIFK